MRIFLLFISFLLVNPCLSIAQEKFVIRQAKKEIELTGYTRSKTVVAVSSEVSGKLLRVNYDVGQTIGEKPFFEIDPTFIDFQISATRQSLKKLNVSQQKITSHVAYLEKEFRRIDKLHKGDRATEVKRDAAKEELEQAKYEAQSISAEKAGLEITLKELQERKRRHHIHAPKGWIVVEKNVEPGEIIGPDMPLAKVADYQTLVVPLAVSSEELASLKQLPKEFDAVLEGKPAKASVHWINPEFNEATRKLGIELVLTQYQGEQRGGLRFSLALEIETEGLLVPKSAIINRYENPRITLKKTGETLNVVVLREYDGYLIIAENERLAVGTELVVKEEPQ